MSHQATTSSPKGERRDGSNNNNNNQKTEVWRYIAPNAVTILSLGAGLTAVIMALEREWLTCCLLVFLAALFDTLDGVVARAVKGSSLFGAELDSLCDLVNFGVVPCLILYLWQLNLLPWPLGWIISVAFAACMACRLARFNTGTDSSSSSASKADYEKKAASKSTRHQRPTIGSSYRHYFTGVPAPAGAILVMAPILWYERLKNHYSFIPVPLPYSCTVVYGAWVVFVSFLLVSTLPTFSSKMFGRDWLPNTLVGKIIGGVLIGIATVIYFVAFGFDGWYAGTALLTVYVGSFPFSYYTFSKLKAAERNQQKKN
eukprot:TRINITY_DN927_c5_g1_i1.p1 TRINITY_DN927_c5_g1~~TRINITY_DN927_c5_g1_i1.p1  ORF type:complete len:315 (-),score=68.19 TRINITY_DN927_c5_g1_i1:62-1006(-)